MKSFQKLFDNLNNAVPVRSADTPLSPQELFRDRQAYRSELRAALAEVNLDDVHDIDGNALYRLQFRATVLPGNNRDQLGAVQATVKPPKLTQKETGELYGSWLQHVNKVLNDDKSPAAILEYEIIAGLTNLYAVIRRKGVRFAVFPGTEERANQLLKSDSRP